MSLIAKAQLGLLAVGFVGGFLVPLYATLMLQRRESRFVKFWNSKDHVAQSEFERKLMRWVKIGARLSMICVVIVVALWLVKNF